LRPIYTTTTLSNLELPNILRGKFTFNFEVAFSEYLTLNKYFKINNINETPVILRSLDYSQDRFYFICKKNLTDLINYKNVLERVFDQNTYIKNLRNITNCHEITLYPFMLGFLKLSKLLYTEILTYKQFNSLDRRFIKSLNGTSVDVRNLQWQFSDIAFDVFKALKQINRYPPCLKIWKAYQLIKAQQIIYPSLSEKSIKDPIFDILIFHDTIKTNISNKRIQQFNLIQFDYQKYQKEFDHNIKIVGTIIPKVREGNCMYFALGTKKFLNRGKIIALTINGKDVHYALKIKDLINKKLYDGSGRITKEQLLAFEPGEYKELFSHKQIRNKILIEDDRFEIWAEDQQKDESIKNIVDLTVDENLKANNLISMII